MVFPVPILYPSFTDIATCPLHTEQIVYEDTMKRSLQNLLDQWNEQESPVKGQALEILKQAEQELPDKPWLTEEPSDEIATLWKDYLETTGRPDFLQNLGDRATRYRWSDSAMGAIQVSRYDLLDMLNRNLREHPGRVFLQDSEGSHVVRGTYEELAPMFRAMAASLYKLAGRQQPRVAILSSNRMDSAATDIACLLYGIFVTPLNVHFDEENLAGVFKQLDINIAVTDTSERLHRLARVSEKINRTIHLVSFEDVGSVGKHEPVRLGEYRTQLGREDIDKILQKRPRRSIYEICTALFTSGSTGVPKGVTFNMYHMVSKRFARAAALPGVGNEEVLLAYLPLYHTFGRYFELLGMMYWGGTYVFSESPSAESLISQLTTIRPTGLISIPLRWVQIHERTLDNLDEAAPMEEARRVVRTIVGDRLRWGISAAGYLDPRVFRFFQNMGVELVSGFGMTEATGGITMSPPGEYKDNTVGVPLPGVEIRFGKEGELQVKAPYIARYLDEAGPGDEVDPVEDYWLATGDLFREIEDSHLEIVDRIKDIYKNN
ncbi:AMP-binding protein, partial [bacterium]|nr:AMP-binding protein [bacterium]